MAMQPASLFIPLTDGLDTYSNPHRLKVGMLTKAEGAAYDAAGYVYPGAIPGPRISITGSPDRTASERLSIIGFDRGGPNPADALLFQSRQAGAPTQVFSLNATTAAKLPVEAYRQSTGLVPYTSPVFDPLANNTPTLPVYLQPQSVATSQYTFYAFVSTPFISSTFFLGFFRQDNVTGETEGPFYLNNGGAPAFDARNATLSSLTVPRVALACTPAGRIFFAANVNSSLKIWEVTGNFGTPATPLILDLGVNANAFEGASGQDAYFAFVLTGEVRVVRAAANFAGAVAFSSGTTATSSSALTLWAQPNSNLVVAGYAGSSSIFFGTSGPTLTTPAFGSFAFSTTATVPQFAVGPSTAAGANGLCWAIERRPSTATTVGTASVRYNYVEFRRTTSTGTTVGTPVFKLGDSGVALMGRPYANIDTATGNVNSLFVLRTGYQQAVTNGLAGNTNAYLVTEQAEIVGKWADNDLGASLQWPAMTAAGASPPFIYAPIGLGCLSAPCLYPARMGAAGVYDFAWTWPQLTYISGFLGAGSASGSSTCSVAFCRFAAPIPRELPTSAQFGQNTVIPGTINAQFDGTDVIEQGFLTRAPYPILTPTTGGSLANGTYSYCTVLAYTDSQGRVIRSAPSQVVSITLTGANNAVNVYLPNYTWSLKGAGKNPVSTELYILSTANGFSTPVFQLLADPTVNFTQPVTTQPADPVALTSMFTLFTDTTGTNILSNPPVIYTYGYSTFAATGTDAPPPFISQCVWGSRIWGIVNRKGPELWFTWTLDNAAVRPEGPTWSSDNRIPLPAEIGQPLAVIGLDDKLLVFGSKTDYVITGSGPTRDKALLDDPTTFSAPIALPTPGGLQVANAVVRVPQGILFQGTQGFTLLDRSLTYNAIGNGINDITDQYTFSAGVLYGERDCVFLPGQDAAGNRLTLVYFYNMDRWATTTSVRNSTTDTTRIDWPDVLTGLRLRAPVVPSQAVSGSSYRVGQSRIALMSTRGPSLLEDYGTYMSLRTPWIELAPQSRDGTFSSVTNTGQLYELEVQGDLAATLPATNGTAGGWGYRLTLTTEYNYENNVQQPPEVQVRDVSNVGANIVTPDLNFRFGFNNGYARRVRFTLTFDASTQPGTTWLGPALPLKQPLLRLSGLVLQYAVDSGISGLGTAYNSAAGV